jgi:hypothetical protein
MPGGRAWLKVGFQHRGRVAASGSAISVTRLLCLPMPCMASGPGALVSAGRRAGPAKEHRSGDPLWCRAMDDQEDVTRPAARPLARGRQASDLPATGAGATLTAEAYRRSEEMIVTSELALRRGSALLPPPGGPPERRRGAARHRQSAARLRHLRAAPDLRGLHRRRRKPRTAAQPRLQRRGAGGCRLLPADHPEGPPSQRRGGLPAPDHAPAEAAGRNGGLCSAP